MDCKLRSFICWWFCRIVLTWFIILCLDNTSNAYFWRWKNGKQARIFPRQLL